MFPVLDTASLSMGEKNALFTTLDEEAKKIFQAFDDFRINFEYLIEQIPLLKFKKAATSITGYYSLKTNIPMLHDRKVEIRKAESHEEVMDIINEYITWFDCRLLKSIMDSKILDSHLNLSARSNFDKELKLYEEKRQLFCKRRIFECPALSIQSNKASKSLKIFCLLTDEGNKTSMNDIEIFLGKLILVLNIQPHNLILHTISKGCIELVLLLPSCVHKMIFPLNEKQLKEFAMLGVTDICTDNSYESISSLISGIQDHPIDPGVSEVDSGK